MSCYLHSGDTTSFRAALTASRSNRFAPRRLFALLAPSLALLLGQVAVAQQVCEGTFTAFGHEFNTGTEAAIYYCAHTAPYPIQVSTITNLDDCQVNFACVAQPYTGITRFPPTGGKDAGVPSGEVCQALRGDPIHTATGNNLQIETDYVGTGPFPLKFIRYYNSQINMPGGLDANWRHEYARELYPIGANPVRVTMKRPDGKVNTFRLNSGVWAADGDVLERLVQVGNQWQLTTSDYQVETYDASGKLQSITNRAGLTQTLSYFLTGPNAGLLEKVTDPFGRTLTFTYDSQSRIATMTGPANEVYAYGYDATINRLTSVTYPDSQDPPRYRRLYHYNEPAYMNNLPGLANIFHLENSLTGISDETSGNAVRFANFGYSYDHNYNRIWPTLAEHAGGAGKITFSGYDLTFYVDTGLTLTRTFGRHSGWKYLNESISGPGPGCQYSYVEYYASDAIKSVTDFNNVKTTFLRGDSARPDLETSRTEAVGTPQARTITTTWHPTFRLPATITEPGRTTAMTYDASGNMLTRTITDTASGQSRTWTYTYNANGQVLTADGPRTDVSDVTSYTYYANDATCPGASAIGCRGQIQTITNAAGQVTRITDYNAHGQPLSITDPNGLVTTLSYDPRMRLTSRNVVGEVTSYEYDGVGDLTKVTLPDASFVQYTYDDAHRLTQINDNLGNKIAYTLDLAGNRTLEQIKDPSGNVMRQTSRIYDALDRLRQITGGLQ